MKGLRHPSAPRSPSSTWPTSWTIITMASRTSSRRRPRREHLPPRGLFEALGVPVPKYATAMIVNAQGKPYSKRDGAAYVRDFREKGLDRSPCSNYLACWGGRGRKAEMKHEEYRRVQASTSREKVGGASAPARWTCASSASERPLPRRTTDGHVQPRRTRLPRQAHWARRWTSPLPQRVPPHAVPHPTLIRHREAWKYFFVELPDYDPKAVDKNLKKDDARAC